MQFATDGDRRLDKRPEREQRHRGMPIWTARQHVHKQVRDALADRAMRFVATPWLVGLTGREWWDRDLQGSIREEVASGRAVSLEDGLVLARPETAEGWPAARASVLGSISEDGDVAYLELALADERLSTLDVQAALTALCAQGVIAGDLRDGSISDWPGMKFRRA